jgi:SAM-dependent methyltransferase
MFSIWLDAGFGVSGIDFAPTALSIAKNPQVSITAGDITNLKFEQRFQVVACVDVLFHVLSNRKWRQFLSSARRCLDKDGFLLIQEHLVEDAEYCGEVQHCHSRRMRDYVEALGSAGLALAKHERYNLPCELTHKDILVLVPQ